MDRCRTRACHWFLAAILAFAAAACGDSRERDLKLAVGAVRGALEDAGRSPIAGMALQQALEGGSVMRYLSANMSPTSLKDFKLETGKPTGPWSIVVTAGDDGQFVVEGYGKDVSKPIVSERVRVARPKGQG